MPLPNSHVIPPGWSQHHQPVAQSAMTSVVDVLLPLADIPAPNPFDPDPGDSTSDVLISGVAARIRPLADDSVVAPSGQTFSTQGYLVQVPTGAVPDILIGKGNHAHRLRITGNPNDTSLEGRVLNILAYPRGSEAFNGDLVCEEHTNQ